MILRAPKGYLDSTIEPGNAMPYEKNTPQNQRYLAPSLSSSGLRTPNTPLTPRVAGSTLSHISTPLLRRATRPGDEGSPPRDDSSSLSTNITPRSGSRKTRISSTNTTPIGTPTGTPELESRLPTEALSYGGGPPRPQLRSAYARPTVFFSGSQVGGGQERSQSQASQNSQSSSKFFYASDVKPTTPAPAQKPRQLGHKRSGLLYGKGLGSTSGYSTSSGVNTVEERSRSKFFHANGTPDAASHNSLPPPTPSYSRAGSTVSSASLAQPPRLAQPKNPSRPVSLNKLDNGGSSYFPPPKAPSGQSSPGHATLTISPESMSTVGAPANELPAPRLARSISGTHKKSLSIGRADVRSSTVSAIGSEIPAAREPVTPFIAASIPLPEDDTEDESVVDNATIASGLRSPVKAGNTLERMNELAAEARRERKVMDLEITNSSLAAINRTLEREMRKQKAELARYRRLSRSGRLSILPGEGEKKKRRLDPSLGGVDEEYEEGNDEEDNMDEEEEEEDSLDPEADDDRSLSPTALAVSDAKQQKRDEKRLQLDLTKHQQMLADSQMMNQSLKRCMSWTEELIKEGKKALEYQVLASEIELGGRVLVADEHDAHDDAMLSARLNGLAYNHEGTLIEDGSEDGSDHLGIDRQTNIV